MSTNNIILIYINVLYLIELFKILLRKLNDPKWASLYANVNAYKQIGLYKYTFCIATVSFRYK